MRALAIVFFLVASLPAAAAPLATFPDPVRAFLATRTVLHIDGMNIFAGRGTPTSSATNKTLDIVLNSSCGFGVCPGIGHQTFEVPIPALAPGDYEVTVRSSPGSEVLATTGLKVVGGNNYQGPWWASPAGVESGWGLQIAHQAETLFVTWYTYDRDGSPAWYVMSDVRLTGDGRYYGYIYRAAAAPSQGTFNLVKSESVRQVGLATFGFNGPDNGTFTYTLDGSTYVKPITRQLFSPVATNCAYTTSIPATGKYQDLWWNAPAESESGWGVQIAHQGDILFATLFGYDAAGEPRWRVVSGARQTAPGKFVGEVYSTRGPAWDAMPWNPAAVSLRPEGLGEFTFSGYSVGAFTISSGAAAPLQKSITRQEFSAYRTACN